MKRFCNHASVGWTLLLACAALGAGGCNDPYAPDRAKSDPLAPEQYPQVSALEGLKTAIVVSNVHENPGPPLGVQVTVRNKTDATERNVQYRFFFMTDGRPENPNPDWHYMLMPARTEVFMQGNALDSAAKEWRLEIRPAR